MLPMTSQKKSRFNFGCTPPTIWNFRNWLPVIFLNLVKHLLRAQFPLKPVSRFL